jgi:lipid-A-disaccharide synthase
MRIVLVAGEASGDQLGAGLIASLRARMPQAQFFGVGGKLMREAGQLQWFDCEQLAVMGLLEVFRHLPRLLQRRKHVLRASLELQAEVYVGIDAPDFNLPIERKLKAAGMRTVHYVSPSIWAWRQQRAKRIGESADLVLCLFPFEPKLYAAHGVAAEFVGHPLADQYPLEPAPMFARTALGLPLHGPILALLPGSRASEVSKLTPAFLAAAKLVRAQIPKLTVIAPMASDKVRAIFEAFRGPENALIAFDGQAQLVLQACDAVIVASGTAALEAALARKPMVVAYKLHPISYWLARTLGLLKTDYFSLPNALAERRLVTELEQGQVTAENIAAHILPKLRGEETSEVALSYLDMHLALKRDANESAAAAIAHFLIDADVAQKNE